MIPEIKRLLILQNSDQKLRTFRLELEAIPVQKAVSERAFAEMSAKLSHVKNRSQEIELKTRQLELEIQSKKAAIIHYKQHQLQTRKNEEYAALSQEIAMAEDAIIKIEDRQLELMEASEKVQFSLREAQRNYDDECKKLEAHLSKLAIRTTVLEASIRELETARLKLSIGLEINLLNQYSRLFKSTKGQAVVPIEGEFCSGCHIKVTPQIVVLVKSEKAITNCLQCGCILY